MFAPVRDFVCTRADHQKRKSLHFVASSVWQSVREKNGCWATLLHSESRNHVLYTALREAFAHAYAAYRVWLRSMPRYVGHAKQVKPKAYGRKVQTNVQRTMQTISAEAIRTRANIHSTPPSSTEPTYRDICRCLPNRKPLHIALCLVTFWHG